MGIARLHRKRHNFSIIDNQGAEDRTLSYKARGLLWYLLTKPDHWTIRISDLIASSSKDGRDSVRSGFKELEVAGYAIRNKVRGEDGRFQWITEIFETKEDAIAWKNQHNEPISHQSGKSVDGFSVDGKPVDIVITDSDSTDLEITHFSNKNNGDKAFQGEKPISAFSEKEEEHHQSGSIPVSTVGDRKKEDPLNPRSEAPLSPKKRKLKVEYDRNGIVQFPKTGKHKLAGVFALRSTQIAIACQYLEFELGRDSEGCFWGSDPQWSEWVVEDELFEQFAPFSKIVNVVMSDQHGVSAYEINETMLEWFEYWSDRLSKAHLKPGNRFSVMPEVAAAIGVELQDVDDDDLEVA